MIILPTMRWFSSISFTSTHTPATSSSPSSKAADTPSTGIGRESPRRRSKSSGGACDDRHYRRGIWPFGASKPWRQKRHDVLSDGEFTTGGASSSKWTGIAAEPVALSRCPSNFEYALPLPLPESPCDISPRKSEVFVNLNFSGDGDCPLPSPKDVPTKTVEQRDRDIDLTRATHKIGDGDLSHTPTKSPYSYQERPVKKDHGESKASRNRNQSSGRSPKNFRVKVPVWSAFPTTLISPNTSPPRMRASDSLSFYCSAPNKGFQTWSAPENPSSPVNPGVSPPRFYHRSSISTDNSPLQSPQGRSPHGFIVHPLPLPPGGSLPSPSAHTSQVTAKLEALQIKNNWQKGKLIGRGTFGSVYVATNRETGALCAMKEVELFPDDPKSAESIKQLEQEIKILSQLKHPNIVLYYGSETVDDKFYIYLEYIHPGSINKYVREHCGAITESVVRNFTRHILSGLAYLHSTKTIHRDIKGANLLVDSCGVVKLADFGMSKHLTGVAAELSLKGSPYWMAPELMQAIMQKDNHPDLALAIDIWSLGCTIIEMLTGKPPWSEFEGVAAMFKVMRDTPPIPDSLSSEGKDFLRCCFERNPADRATASMLLEHQFVKNSSRPDIPTSIHESIGITNLTDKLSSPREQSPSMQIAMGNTGVER